jgi:hypothetical protein
MIVSAGVFGSVKISSVGTGELETVPFGETLEFAPSGSYRANIFTTRDLATAPMCEVTTSAGEPVTLRDGTPYNVNTRYDMEASYGFHLDDGVTYLVRCGEPGQRGSFALVEVSPTAQRIALGVGLVGAVLLAVGIGGALVRRRSRRTRRDPRSPASSAPSAP